MAKNKVYLTVLVALLAGCAVLVGCAGEGAYDVPESVDNSMNVSDNPGGEIPPEISVESTGDDKEKDREKAPYTPPFPEPPLPQVQELGTYPGLDAETERQVKQAWVDFRGGETERVRWEYVRFDYYYGNFNGCVVIAMRYIMAVVTDVSLGGKVFSLGDANMYACKDGRIYQAEEAYDLGLLNDDNVNKMYERHLLYERNRVTNPGMNNLPVIWLEDEGERS